MARCILCGKETTILRRRKLSDGAWICHPCEKALPFPFREFPYASSGDMQNGAEYARFAEETLYPAFSKTCSYGRMALDERHGLFVFCDATNFGKDGKLKQFVPDIYHCMSVGNPSFLVEDTGYAAKTVTCRVLFEGSLNRYHVNLRTYIRKQVPCPVRPYENGSAFMEPADLSTFRNLYNQMLEIQLNLYRRQKEEETRQYEEKRRRDERIREEQERKRKEEKERESAAAQPLDMELKQAMSLFMVEEGYTLQDLKRQRANLMSVFHPDNGRVTDPVYASKINHAYELLVGRLNQP